ncbi:MAG: helix-turn-helix transcriptional regulator [Acinetobacter sp.]
MYSTKAFAQFIYNLRIEKGLKQLTASQKIGMAQAALSAFENGSHYPTIINSCKLSTFYELSLDTLFGIHADDNDDLETMFDERQMAFKSKLNERIAKRVCNETNIEVTNEVNDGQQIHACWRL